MSQYWTFSFREWMGRRVEIAPNIIPAPVHLGKLTGTVASLWCYKPWERTTSELNRLCFLKIELLTHWGNGCVHRAYFNQGQINKVNDIILDRKTEAVWLPMWCVPFSVMFNYGSICQVQFSSPVILRDHTEKSLPANLLWTLSHNNTCFNNITQHTLTDRLLPAWTRY